LKFHRTTISIPAGLRERMKDVSRDNEINWSAVAAAAFLAAVERLEREAVASRPDSGITMMMVTDVRM
jgi:hypothetical protein